LTRLAAIHPLWSEVAELHVFGHRSTAEIATILGIGASTARKRWTSAKRWLKAELTSDQARPAAPERKKTGPR
jgi:DNA-directed RNA polymerase specialized sigma24 family protein